MQRILAVLLILVLLASGLAVIYAKHHSRLVFIEIQKAELVLEELEVSWERLTL
ncbi:MAG: cell division protein FtsL, partial [Methyloprofundus sp.]|nr:cell division protein FtsL [Methyloprofundus sp.]